MFNIYPILKFLENSINCYRSFIILENYLLIDLAIWSFNNLIPLSLVLQNFPSYLFEFLPCLYWTDCWALVTSISILQKFPNFLVQSGSLCHYGNIFSSILYIFCHFNGNFWEMKTKNHGLKVFSLENQTTFELWFYHFFVCYLDSQGFCLW